MNKDDRKKLIAEFFEHVGGVSVLAHRSGMSEPSLRICKTRARLTNKYELMRIADQTAFALPGFIFEPAP